MTNKLTDDVKKVLETCQLRVVRANYKNDVWRLHIHLNDYRFCEFDKLEMDLAAVKWQLLDAEDSAAINMIRIRAI